MTNINLEGFVQARDGRIVDRDGRPALVRGVGLGNWLLPEGYMWRFVDTGPQSPREIEKLIADLVGTERAAEFWDGFRKRFITPDDIRRIAAEGFDHVRLPLNARSLIAADGTFLEDGFAIVAECVGWCREAGLWVVLDLHGAPGGQTGTNIDDSLGTPALFEDEANRALTLRLWRELAVRYREDTVVAAYDLLNEPLPNEYQYTYAAELVALYRELTAEIRSVDPDHLIMYEGSHWATNWTIFTEVWDDNSALQFHKYWSPPDVATIQGFIDVGHDLGLPIYMGEGGENNLDWLQTAFQLYEDRGIGWNLWPWKKIDTVTSPCSVLAPAGWQDIVDFGVGKAEQPDADAAWATLRELLDNVDVSRCVFRTEVVDAVMRRAPLRLASTGFGFRGEGVSYQCRNAQPLRSFRNEDRVTIRYAGGAEPEEVNFWHNFGAPRPVEEELLLQLGPGDWVAYSFETAAAARWGVTVEVVAAGESAPVEVAIDGDPLDVAGDDAHTDTDAAGASIRFRTRDVVDAGPHTLRLTGVALETRVRFLQIA